MITDPRTETEARYAEWAAAKHRQYRASNAARCPRAVAGLRCKGPTGCVCSHRGLILDHVRMWLDPQGRRVLTAEPYDTHGEDLADLIADVAALGLEVSFAGYSPWSPGGTFLLTIHQPQENTPS